MAISKAISDFGNGRGYIYVVDLDGTTILGIENNTLQGARNIRKYASANAPIAANRGAFATIDITACAGLGNVTSVQVLGNELLGASVPISTAVVATTATDVAAAINIFTPGSGYKFTAQAIAGQVILYAPTSAGSALNGIIPTMSVDTPSCVFTITGFSGGSENTGSYDNVIGRRFYLNADYGTTGISGSGTALPNSLTNAAEITDDVTVRGTEAGFDVKHITIDSDAINSITRICALTLIYADTEGSAATDYLVKINPTGFVEGDIIVLRGVSDTRVITIVSEPNASGVSSTPDPNVYLSGNVNFTTDTVSKAIILTFKNDTTLGGIFTETARASQLNGKTNYMTFFDTDSSVADSPSMFYDPIALKYAMSNLDTQATPSLLNNMDGLLSMIVDKTVGQTMLSVQPDGLTTNNFKLVFGSVGTYPTTQAQWSFEADRLLIWPSDALATGGVVMNDGNIAIGSRNGNLNAATIALSGDYMYAGFAITDIGYNFHLYGLTDNTVPINEMIDSNYMSIIQTVSSTTNAYEWMIQGIADNASTPGTGKPVFKLMLRKLDLTDPVNPIVVSTLDILSSDMNGLLTIPGSIAAITVVGAVTAGSLSVGGAATIAGLITCGGLTTTGSVTATSSVVTNHISVTAGTFKGQTTLVAGTKTVTASVTTLAQVQLTRVSGVTGNFGHLYLANLVAGVSFDIVSTNVADTSVVNWLLT